MKSMTGYASVDKVFPALGQCISLELKTLNSRHLEFKLKSPLEYSFLEPRILQEVKKYMSRGFVELIVSRERLTHSKASAPNLNDEAVRHVLREMSRVKRKFHIQGEVTVDHLLSLPTIWKTSDVSNSSLPWKAFSSLLLDCLKKGGHMRQKEGEALAKAILQYLNDFEILVLEILKNTKDLAQAYDQKLREKISQLTHEKSLDPARLHQEVAYLIEKADVSEELTRLQSHIQQFRGTCKKEGPIGKNLDFLLQEMNREINTIGSKSLDSHIPNLVIQCKSLLEKMREQVQNVE